MHRLITRLPSTSLRCQSIIRLHTCQPSHLIRTIPCTTSHHTILSRGVATGPSTTTSTPTSSSAAVSTTSTSESKPVKPSSSSSSSSPSPRRSRPWRTLFVAGLAAYFTVTTYNILTDDESWQYQVIRYIPYRILSRTWGWIHNKELPADWMKQALYGAWIRFFDVNMSEASNPDLLSYPNLASFFIRTLRSDVRPISNDPLVSPVDALVTVIGEVTPDGRLDHIKGMSYALSDMLGVDPLQLVAKTPILPPDVKVTNPPQQNIHKKLYYCVLYLAPGDYHRIHSPTNITLTHRMHFPGDLFPVSPSIARYVKSLFTRNERVALYGTWKYGFFSMTAVGALNVGGIKLAIEPEVKTNRSWQHGDDLILNEPYGPGTGGYLREYGKLHVPKGAEVARFELGSTVVLVFETAEHAFQFSVKEGDRVKVGQSIGSIQPLSWSQPPLAAVNL